jgi:hypothetical protein
MVLVIPHLLVGTKTDNMVYVGQRDGTLRCICGYNNLDSIFDGLKS